jgi:uncharacterized membrane protein
MDPSRDSEIDARLARIEAAIVGLERSLAALVAERRAPPRSQTPPPSHAPSYPNPPISPRRRDTSDELGPALSSWFSSRNPEWWLSRVGIGFVILAVLLLYGFAIDHGWITPPIRVLAGVTVGAVVFWAATRVRRPAEPAANTELGFRELLFGGALAIWYTTAYAAAVWYQLIPIPLARLVFFVLGIVSTWIALEERREIFAFVAVGTGFATPFVLPAPVESITELSLYLGAVTAIGLVIYVMRGWHSIIWIAYLGFWVSIGIKAYPNVPPTSAALGSLSLSILLIAVSAAFTRAPSLRRQLLPLGSARYTPTPITSGIRRLMKAMDSLSEALGGGKSAPDSLILWILTLVSAVLLVDFLGEVWPHTPDEIKGVVLVLLGLGALALSRRSAAADAEIVHVEVTAAVYWTLSGVGLIVPTPENLPTYALVVALVIGSGAGRVAGPRTLAKLAIGLTLLTVVGHELSVADTGLLHLRWVAAEIATLGAAAFTAQRLIATKGEEGQGIVVAAAGYLTALIVVWRALDPIWAPLVTTTYAILGALLLILSRREGSHSVLKYLGGATMLIVVARLLLVDLSSVETIWRVLLFLVCGAVFLYTGYRMQPRPRD